MRRPDRLTLSAGAAVALFGVLATLAGTGGAVDVLPAAGPYTEQLVAQAAGDCKAAADVNGDGKVDVLVGGLTLTWYEAPTWAPHPVQAADREFTTDCQATDVDGDGDSDLVVPDGAPGSGNLYWFDNDGAGTFTRRLIGSTGYRHDVEVADLTGDGRVDVVVRRIGDLTVWYRDGSGAWASRRLSGRGGEGTGLGDLDGDGWVDVLLGGYWLRNPGTIAGTWTERTIQATDWASIAVGDVDGDGRADVVLGPIESTGDEHAWYSATDPLNGPWSRHVIKSGTGAGFHTHKLADMDGDGRLDLVTGKMSGGLWVYANKAEGWEERLVSTRQVHNLRVADVDGNGVPDILTSGYIGNPPTYVALGPVPAGPPPSTTAPPTTAPPTTAPPTTAPPTTAPPSTVPPPTTAPPTTAPPSTVPPATSVPPATVPEGSLPVVVTVVATSDAHVRNGSTARTNYGRAIALEVKTDTVYGYSREAYLTFPLPGAAHPGRAVLRLTAQLQKGTLGLAAHQVAVAPTEVTVTWDRRPALGAVLSSRTITGTASQVVERDVTAAVLAARSAGQATVTLGLRSTTRGEALLSVSSREAAADRRPQLVLHAP